MSTPRPNPSILPAEDRPAFVETGLIAGITARALRYLKAGYAVHLRGPAGTGKSSLAMHMAARLGRPIVLLLGDEDLGSREMIGNHSGVRHRKVVDEYVHSVTKTEDTVTRMWVDSRLTTAVRNGFTLVYDEFTRSRAETNNPLLSILEERVLPLPPDAVGTANYVPVHEEFRAIFTSNPEEYAGVHKSQDALQDRMITLDIDGYDGETETAITASRSNLCIEDAGFVVHLVRAVRERAKTRHFPTLRSSIMLSRIVERADLAIDASDEWFCETFRDVIVSESCRRNSGALHRDEILLAVNDVLREAFPPELAGALAPPGPEPLPAEVTAAEADAAPGQEGLTVQDIQRFFRSR